MKKDTKIVLMISFSVFLIIFLLFFVIQKGKNDNYNNIKEDKKNFLVYTKYEQKGKVYSIYVPYINIKSDNVKAANEDIDLFVSEFIESKKAMISYEYNINGIILSVVVKIVDYDAEYAPQAYFRTYNINLDTLELIADDALLEFFEVSEENVAEKIENQFKYYYKKIVEEDYYEEDECSYSCFLKYREVDDYLNDICYYVKDGNLIVYKPFVFYSIYGEEEYFKDKHFEFLIVKKES